MLKIGVISNPKSYRNQRGLDHVKEYADGQNDVVHRVLTSVADIPEIIGHFVETEIGILAIIGGDGTVQATLTHLFRSRPFEQMPVLAVLPGGRTNMIAADMGLNGRSDHILEKLISLVQTNDWSKYVTQRQVLRIQNSTEAETQFGMFFGAAGICRAIQACRRTYHPYKLSSNVATALTLVGSIGRLLIGRHDTDQICRGDEFTISLDGETRNSCSCLLVLATTLNKLLFGSQPYWTDREGTVHFSFITYPPKDVGRSAYRFLFGGEDRQLPVGSYFSQDVNSIRLSFDGPYTLDGEFFDSTAGAEIVLSGEDQASFIKL